MFRDCRISWVASLIFFMSSNCTFILPSPLFGQIQQTTSDDFVLFFAENRIQHFMKIVSLVD